MTRHLLDIGDRNRTKEPWFSLIKLDRDVMDPRRHFANVTTAGKALMHQIINALKLTPKKEKSKT